MAIRKSKPKAEPKPLVIKAKEGETKPQTMSRVLVAPYLRHGILGHAVTEKAFGKVPGDAQFDDFGRAIKARAEDLIAGDKTFSSELLMSQAISLDALFTELARRSVSNLGDYPQAAERYARLAFKAQANSRATLEALAKLHQPREQTVRHVHVNEGGQAVIADEFHHHTGGQENGQSSEQPHATGTVAAGASAALPGPDAIGQTLPIPGGERQEPLPNARGQGQRRA